ncbi:hypothetical protein [Nitrospirillum sp. BR 11828]|uniref:hypothetical protein n=1 Tax=Nitrospirillum sp. BR 11828 TaxID=3104325 RepID=UPI002ACAB951|nr:hypothetical protein [Nitrospirillum sp. BR 11828]MDZ5650220.1 hypothetical protein [Nitrospirillum sp. BR 11828]
MTELRHKSVDIAVELCKQIITLSSAVIGLSVGLLKDSQKGGGFLIASSCFAILSIIFGLLFLMVAVTNINEHSEKIDIYRKSIKIPIGNQIFLFVLSLLSLIAHIF